MDQGKEQVPDPAGAENVPEEMTATAPPVSEPQHENLFDRDELLERVDNDLELLQRMLELFCRDFPTLIEKALQAIVTADRQILHDSTHTLKGMLGNLSAHTLAAIAQQLKGMDPEVEAQQARETLAELEVQTTQLVRTLTAFLKLTRNADH